MSEYNLAHKTVIGPVERVFIDGASVLARIDTGATTSSIDLGLASSLKLGPLVAKRTVVSAHGKKIRPVIKATIKLKGKELHASFTVIDRTHMRYRMLIGRNILKKNFLIDPSLPMPPPEKK